MGNATLILRFLSFLGILGGDSLSEPPTRHQKRPLSFGLCYHFKIPIPVYVDIFCHAISQGRNSKVFDNLTIGSWTLGPPTNSNIDGLSEERDFKGAMLWDNTETTLRTDATYVVHTALLALRPGCQRGGGSFKRPCSLLCLLWHAVLAQLGPGLWKFPSVLSVHHSDQHKMLCPQDAFSTGQLQTKPCSSYARFDHSCWQPCMTSIDSAVTVILLFCQEPRLLDRWSTSRLDRTASCPGTRAKLAKPLAEKGVARNPSLEAVAQIDQDSPIPKAPLQRPSFNRVVIALTRGIVFIRSTEHFWA